MMKPLASALSGVGRGSGRWGNDPNNVRCKAIRNWHNESPLYNEYVLIKVKNMKGRIMKRKVPVQHFQEVPMKPV
jgi:hypothetical protein